MRQEDSRLTGGAPSVIGHDGATLLKIPLTAGIVGAVVAPVLVAVGAIAALATNYTLLVEARGESKPKEHDGAA